MRNLLIAAFWLFPYFVAASTPQQEVDVALALAAAQRARAVKPVVAPAVSLSDWHELQPGEVLLQGNHWHHDPVTGLWKQHGPENDKNLAAHVGPKGNLVLEKSAGPVRQRTIIGYRKVCDWRGCRMEPIFGN